MKVKVKYQDKIYTALWDKEWQCFWIDPFHEPINPGKVQIIKK
jgi:hypothetical protein